MAGLLGWGVASGKEYDLGEANGSSRVGEEPDPEGSGGGEPR